MSARRTALAGARAIAPLLLGVVPFGLVYGVTAAEIGLSTLQGAAMSVLVFAGAAQLAAVDLLSRDAPVAVAVLAAIVVNLRYVMYSASIAPYLRRLRTDWRWLCGYLLTDQAYAVSVATYRREDLGRQERKWYYLGASVAIWSTWQVTTVIGLVLGARLPAGLSLEFVIPLVFTTLLVPTVEDRATKTAAAIAAVVAVLAASVPYDLGLVTAGMTGVAAGGLVQFRSGDGPEDSGTGSHGDDADGRADDREESP